MALYFFSLHAFEDMVSPPPKVALALTQQVFKEDGSTYYAIS